MYTFLNVIYISLLHAFSFLFPVLSGQSPGGVAILRRDNRDVYYLVTKEKYWHKPTYATLTSSLQAMKAHCVKQGTTEVAMPTIGCGLDGLSWPKVCEIIRDVFRETDVAVTVYVL